MDLKTAVEILELDENKISPEIIKKAYRQLSLKYHPDVTGNSDGSKFILINAAYEFLKKEIFNYSSNEFSETEEELNLRIIAIRKAFDNIKGRYQEIHDKTFITLANSLKLLLDRYNSHRDLQKNINRDFQTQVTISINNIINWFNSEIFKITSAYDDWLNGMLRSTYQKLLEDEFKYWYRSKYFYKHLGISLIFSLVSFALMYYYSPEKYYISFATLPLVAGIYSYKSNVKKKYSYKTNVKGLDSNNFRMSSTQLFIKADSNSMVKTSMGMGSIGALIGSIGGPLGAVVGGAIGGFLGALFGESLDELKEKMRKEIINKLFDVEELILKNLEIQIPKIEEQLIESIKKNYISNKQKAVKLLLNANK